MAQGLLVKNDSGQVLIDSDFHNYHFMGKYSHTGSSVQIPDILHGPGNQSFGPNHNKGMENMPSKGLIWKYSIPSNGAKPPLCFIKPNSTGTSAVYRGIILTKRVGAIWEVWVFQSGTESGIPELYCFSPIDQLSGMTTGSNGLRTFNSSGECTFDSRLKPLRVVGGGVCQSPGMAHTGSNGSSWNVSLNVNNTTDTVSFTTQSDANDLIYYLPSISHACQQYLHDETDSGIYDWDFYEWARSDIWWCFYRSCFRIRNSGTIEISHGVYARGHVHDHKADSSSVFAGLILGALTGGAYFAIALAAVVASGAFTNAGVLEGSYLPYENSHRNANQNNAFMISKASYYN
jgi:hypothetical protein